MGAGFIGVSFAAVFADAGWRVTIVDPDAARLANAKSRMLGQIDAIGLSGLSRDQGGRVDCAGSADLVLQDADLVLECGPEDVSAKQAIFADLLAKVKPETVLATASSAIPMSRIVADTKKQARCVVAHPVNPPAVLRLIELCPAPGTTVAAMDMARDHFTRVGFAPVILSREIEGFVMNRLQGSVLREAYRLVDEGVVEPDDVDRVMRLGLGPRWALSGPFETAELNTPGGVCAHAARMGPAYRRMGEERGETVAWSAELVARVAQARDAARGGVSVEQRAVWRARAVAKLVALRDRLLKGGP